MNISVTASPTARVCRVCGVTFAASADWVTCCSDACADQGLHAERLRERWTACEHRRELMPHRNPLAAIRAKNPEAWAWADAWDRSRNVYAVGPEGVGKSALCKYLLTRDVDAGRLVRVAQMTRIEAAGWSDRHADYVAALQDCSTLLLDDIHAVAWTDHGAGVLRAVIDWRHEAGMRTLCTSNITMREMAARLDKVMGDGWGLQTMRRLSPVHVLTMGGESYRLEMQRVNQDGGARVIDVTTKGE